MSNYKNSITDLVHLGNQMYEGNQDLEKSNTHITIEFIEYLPKALVRTTVLKKTSDTIAATSLCTGEELAENTSQYDTFIQVIDGAAEVFIEDKKYILRTGNGIIIPALASHCINANEQFKMISTVINS